MIVAERNNAQMLWKPEHKWIDDNETADQLARNVTLLPFIKP
jgi:hypothetical protein